MFATVASVISGVTYWKEFCTMQEKSMTQHIMILPHSAIKNVLINEKKKEYLKY
jgi:hypothetical protein